VRREEREVEEKKERIEGGGTICHRKGWGEGRKGERKKERRGKIREKGERGSREERGEEERGERAGK
jgi:hypothetical protein